jgi:GntR family transcriptional regulator
MRILISNSSADSLHEQISAQLRAQVIGGGLEAGAALPSIRTLARELGVSIITVKRAYDDLEGQGFIDSVQGRGTFVARQKDEVLRDRKRRLVEDRLSEAVGEARALGIEGRELREMLDLLIREEGL